MFGPHLLGDAVGAEAVDIAAHEKPRLVDGIASASPASPNTTRLPDCAMKADMWPILPRTTMSMPFIEMPQRDDALPSMTSRPPLPVAPAYWLASPLMMIEPTSCSRRRRVPPSRVL